MSASYRSRLVWRSHLRHAAQDCAGLWLERTKGYSYSIVVQVYGLWSRHGDLPFLPCLHVSKTKVRRNTSTRCSHLCNQPPGKTAEITHPHPLSHTMHGGDVSTQAVPYSDDTEVCVVC